MSRSVVLVWWVAWSAAGAVVIALPDSGPRLLTFSAAHGPGMLDAVGILLLLLGSAAPWFYLWRRRSAISASRWWVFAAGLSAGLLLASVFSDFGAWWAVGAAILLAFQVMLIWRTQP